MRSIWGSYEACSSATCGCALHVEATALLSMDPCAARCLSMLPLSASRNMKKAYHKLMRSKNVRGCVRPPYSRPRTPLQMPRLPTARNVDTFGGPRCCPYHAIGHRYNKNDLAMILCQADNQKREKVTTTHQRHSMPQFISQCAYTTCSGRC